MTDTDGNAWFRDALDAARNRGPATVEAEPSGETDEAETKPFPDLGQGARGPLPAPPPNMSDALRGTRAAQRDAVSTEIEFERQFRTRSAP